MPKKTYLKIYTNNFKVIVGIHLKKYNLCIFSPCCRDYFEPHKARRPQFLWTLIFTSICFKENPFTNPGMYLMWISGFDISPMWMSPWLNGLKSASSAVHSMYYSPLFAKLSLYRLYVIHFCSPAEARSDLFRKHFNSN